LNLTDSRNDIEALVHGKPLFLQDLGINVDLTPIVFNGGPININFLHGRMVRGPGLRCGLQGASWAGALAALPEGVQAFRDGSLVGVVAATEEAAEKAASKLQRLLKWDVEALPACREGGVDFFGEGIAATKGRAIDLSLTGRYAFSKSLQGNIGYRLLEGGANGTNGYNFIQLHFIFASLNYSFNKNGINDN
jgi:hypothetical protein